jgi:hypothetical protein
MEERGMPTAKSKSWEELDPQTRRELDEQYLDELKNWGEPPLSEEGIKTYLSYRHQRPQAAITTYEEGQIRKLIHGLTDPSKSQDPVEQEEHLDPLEVFGAKRFHWTNAQSYLAVMLLLTFVFVLFFLVFVISR